jgi:dephospho-CoA kinase
MKNAVVGFSGGIASGKSSLSSAVSEALGWPRTSFGGYVRLVASQRGLEPTRETCQKIGEELIQKDAHDFCKHVLSQVSWSPGKPLVIDGIRHLQVADLLAEMVRPSDFMLVFADLPRDERKIRLRNRDGGSQSLEAFERHSTEAQIADLRDRADLVVAIDRPVDQLTDEIVRFLAS